MALYLINISPDNQRVIDELIKSRRYESLEHFVEVAIRNQIVYETQQEELRLSAFKGVATRKNRVVKATTTGEYKLEPRPLWAFSDSNIKPLPNVQPAKGPLWGQFYRFLPLKLVIRLLADAQRESLVDLESFGKRILPEVLHLAKQLRLADNDGQTVGGLSLSAGFPSPERDLGKSWKRFCSQYIGRVRSDGTLDGFPAALGFVGVECQKDKTIIGLTKIGIQFASLFNPVLDDGVITQPLSEEEVSFLIYHIVREMPGESSQLREIVKLISNGLNTPKELDLHLGKYYKKRFPNENWTFAKVSVMRAGAVSRLAEMGLVVVIKKGGLVKYLLQQDYMNEVASPLKEE